MLTLVLALGFAVVGTAGTASAWRNTVSGTVTCATGGGWSVTWRVVNSERSNETITASNRAVVPVGTVLGPVENRSFTEVVTAKPSSGLTLTITGKWTNGESTTNSGSIASSSFSDSCAVTTVATPSVPMVDDCGPGNAVYGAVPSGPWTSVVNPDGSLTIIANQGYTFPNGQTSVTYPQPTDSNVACPTPPPPVVTPPVVTPAEVLPAQVRVVRAAARSIDKCGSRSDLFKVARRSGVIYRSNGKVLREGVWLKARNRSVTVRATAADATFQLRGKATWRLTFTRKVCAPAPEVAPNTGA